MIKKFRKITFTSVFAFLVLIGSLYSQETAISAFGEGCDAFFKEDWASAVISLRKAITYSECKNPDTLYMLISAEMYLDDNDSALKDCDEFLTSYKRSMYYPNVQFIKGKTLYKLGQFENAISVLSEFCSKNEKNDSLGVSELYPSALYLIAESLYADYNYEEAKNIYSKILIDYPDSDKALPSQYRLENIEQYAREQKLLYLLKQTGEEYLSAKEDYEKQLRLYNSQTSSSVREKLTESQQKNVDLENKINELNQQLSDLQKEKESSGDDGFIIITSNDGNSEAIRKLKLKALDAQNLINKQAQNEKSN